MIPGDLQLSGVCLMHQERKARLALLLFYVLRPCIRRQWAPLNFTAEYSKRALFFLSVRFLCPNLN